MVSSLVLLTLAPFIVSIGNFIESLRRLQRLLANSIEKRGAGQPKEWNPRRSPELCRAAPNPQTRESPGSAQKAARGSISCFRQNGCGNHREVESWGARGLLPAACRAWPHGVAPFPCTRAQAALAEGSATGADRVAAHATRRAHRSSLHLRVRVRSTNTCWRDRQKQWDATDDATWAIPEVPAIARGDSAAQQTVAPAIPEIPSAGLCGPSTAAAGCENLPAMAGCVHASGYTVQRFSRWSRNSAGGTGKSGRAKLARSGCRLRHTLKGRPEHGLALGDIVVGLEKEKDRDTAPACAAANLPNLRRGDRKRRKESRCLCRDSLPQAMPSNLLDR